LFITRRCALLTLASTGYAFAAQRTGQPYSVVAGTVFQDNGLSFPSVQVKLEGKGAPSRTQTAKTSNRGEFAFRVPPEARTYTVTATKKGFRTASTDAEVPGEGRVDVTITLQAESK